MTLSWIIIAVIFPGSIWGYEIWGTVNKLQSLDGEHDDGKILIGVKELGETTLAFSDGSFYFSNVPWGEYTLIFSAEGFFREDKVIRVPLKKSIIIVLYPSIFMFDEIIITEERQQPPPGIVALQEDIEFIHDPNKREDLYERHPEWKSLLTEEIPKGIDISGLIIFLIENLKGSN